MERFAVVARTVFWMLKDGLLFARWMRVVVSIFSWVGW